MRSIHPCERFILYRYSWKEIISFIFLNMANCGQWWIHHFFSFFTLLGMEHPENTFPHSAGLYRSWIWLNTYCYLLLLLNKSYTCYYTGNNICYNICVCYNICYNTCNNIGFSQSIPLIPLFTLNYVLLNYSYILHFYVINGK